MAKKEEKETGVQKIESAEVTVIPSKEELQAGMRKTLKDLDEKLEKLSVPEENPWKVGSITFRTDGYDLSFTINQQNDLFQLVKALIMSRRSIEDFNKVQKEFNLSAHTTCLIGGYKAEEVVDELERRIKIINNTKIIADIKAAKTKLEAFLSEDDRLIKTLSEVEGLLK